MDLAEGTRKRSRSSSGGSSGGDGELDRLSALPDCLLHEIMSSLKARQVVQTCVLSTRWRHLWRSVPCLDVDIAEFRCSGGGGSDRSSSSNKSSSDDDSSDSAADYDYDDFDLEYFDDKGQGWVEFEDFAASLMHRCNLAQLDSFRLDIDRGRKPPFVRRTGGVSHDSWTYSGRQAEAWLRRAMKYCTAPGPTEHNATISRQRQGLNLSTSSWRLKRLHLRYVPLDSSFGEHLNSVCRSLEDLELDNCPCEIRKIASDSLKKLVLKSCAMNGFLSDIACPTLKTLVIDGGSNGYVNPHPHPLAISAPMVSYLRLFLNAGSFHGGISINKKMPSLDRASIHLRRHKYGSSRGMFGRLLYGDQSELLRSVCNVTSLELSGVGTMVLGKEPKFQEFQNLRNLLLGGCDLSDDFRLLRFFHQGSPNLEKVTLRHCKFPGDSNEKEGTHNDADDKEGTHSDSDSSDCCCGMDFPHVRMNPQFPAGGRHKLDKTSSSDRCGLDFLRDENVELEIIHKKR